MHFFKVAACGLLFALLTCSSPPVPGLVVVVTVNPETPSNELFELRATVQVNGKTASPIDTIKVKPGIPNVFSLKLDQGIRGKLDLTVEGRPDYAYVTHKGTGTIQIDEDRRYNTTVDLKYQKQCSGTGWCWEHARPRGNALNDVWGTGPNDIWVVGEGGTILHYDGWAFSSVPILDNELGNDATTNPRFTAVHGTSATDVWVISGIRGGQKQRRSICKYNASTFKFACEYKATPDNNDITFRTLWVTNDNLWIDGIKFDKKFPIVENDINPPVVPSLPSPARPQFYRTLGNNPQDPSDLWAVGSIYDTSKLNNMDTPAIWHWDSTHWKQEQIDSSVINTNVPLYHIWANESGELWASGRTGEFNLYKSPTSQMWVKNAHPNANLKGIVYGASQGGIALAISGSAHELRLPTQSRNPKILFSQPNTTIQTTLTDGLGILRAFTVPGQSPPVMYLVGEGGLILRYDVQKNESTVLIPGTSASPAYVPKTIVKSAHLNDIFGFSDTDIWAVGNQGTILHYDGSTWTEASPKITQNNLRAVWGASAEDVWAVGDNATILRRTTASGAFNQVTSPVPINKLNGVWGTSAQNIFAVGDSGTLLRWDGSSWNQSNNTGFAGHFQGVWASDSENVFVAGFLFSVGSVYLGNGTTWTDITPTASPLLKTAINKIRGTSRTHVVITDGIENGNKTWIYNGTSWQPIDKSTRYGIVTFGAASTYLVGYEDGLLSTDSNTNNRSIGGSNFLNAMWGTSPTNMWAVGESGSILHYQGSTAP